MSTILGTHTDKEAVAELGVRLRALRLNQNLTVDSVATKAGLNRNTILNAESGKNPRLGTLVRLLRVYGRIEALNAFIAPVSVSPLHVVKAARVRQRASGKHG